MYSHYLRTMITVMVFAFFIENFIENFDHIGGENGQAAELLNCGEDLKREFQYKYRLS